jgi:predicted kinase
MSEAPAVTVVVTGLPGAGKTTLARALSEAAGGRFLSLDAIKEALFESAGGRLEGVELRLAAEAELRDRLATECTPAVVDIWVRPHRDTARVAELLRSSASPLVEVLCRVPTEVALDRYRDRVRFGPHRPADARMLQSIRDVAADLAPLGVGPCLEVDTSEPVDVGRLVRRLRRAGLCRGVDRGAGSAHRDPW